jgi:transaldolase/glucose-6-phosphate isomerase
LSHFGLFPAAMIGADLEPLLESARAVDWEASVEMGVAWGKAAQQGRDKLTLLTSPTLDAYPDWIEQLVAESLGKVGRGIVPVAREPRLGSYQEDRFFLTVSLSGEKAQDPASGHPSISREISHPDQLAGEMFGAEVATSVAGAVLGVHPFDQPDVELAKQRARQALAGESAGEDLFEVDSPTLPARLEDLLGGMVEGDYFAIHAYLPMEQEIVDRLDQVRSLVGNRGGWATTAGFGPRFLHSTGQLHKGGPNRGVFLQLVDRPHRDLAVPESGTSFGRIIAAQAAGDYLALRERGRRVLRVDLGPDREAGLGSLLESLP